MDKIINNKLNKIAIIFIIAILFFSVKSFAGTQNIKGLNYDVTLNSDGSMDVIETINVLITDTNTMFKKMNIKQKEKEYLKLNPQIENVKIYRVDESGKEYELYNTNTYQYHVDKDGFYALQIESNKFEIAWHVGCENITENRIYKIQYRIRNAIKIYKDCTEFCWQFIDRSNTLKMENVTGTIKLPKEVAESEDLRVWGHGAPYGNVEKVSNDTIVFDSYLQKPKELLEIRIVTQENIYPDSINFIKRNSFDAILKSESSKAEDANKKREEAKNEIKVNAEKEGNSQEKEILDENLLLEQKLIEEKNEEIKKEEDNKLMMKAAIISFGILNFIVYLISIPIIKIYKSVGNKLEKEYSNKKYDIEYFRDIPNEKEATPARVSYLQSASENFKNPNMKYSKVFSATILDLSLRGIIGFEVESEKNIKIFIMKNGEEKAENLPEDEKAIFEILKTAMGNNKFINTNNFENYANSEYNFLLKKMKEANKSAKKYNEDTGNISKTKKVIKNKWKTRSKIFIVPGVICTIFLSPIIMIGISLFRLSYICNKNSKLVENILTEKGNLELAEWMGLKKYMEDYSLLNEKVVPDIVLWEKYLVYATTFGISKKVIEQLKNAHPEIFIQSSATKYGYWNNICENSLYAIDAFEYFNDTIDSIYTTTNDLYTNNSYSSYDYSSSSYSDSSGGGGGFSSGGGSGDGGGSYGGR